MNYTEAISNVHRAYASSHESVLDELFSTLPPLSDEESKGKERERGSLSEHSFRLLLEALKSFLSVYHQPPLKGSIPDMTSTSEHFVNLQQVLISRYILISNLFLDRFSSRRLKMIAWPLHTSSPSYCRFQYSPFL